VSGILTVVAAGLDHGLNDAAEVVHLAAGSVFGRPFNVVDLVARAVTLAIESSITCFRRHVEF